MGMDHKLSTAQDGETLEEWLSRVMQGDLIAGDIFKIIIMIAILVCLIIVAIRIIKYFLGTSKNIQNKSKPIYPQLQQNTDNTNNTLEPIICRHCGASLQPDEMKSTTMCPYCKTPYRKK
jgi:predicted Zn-ribbon and HTH transcriptional regulator